MEDLSKALKDCPPGKELWITGGKVVKNIYELEKAIKKQDDYSFSYHVNDDNHKNDYARWVIDVLGDKELCNRLLRAKEKNEFLEIVHNRIAELEIA